MDVSNKVKNEEINALNFEVNFLREKSGKMLSDIQCLKESKKILELNDMSSCDLDTLISKLSEESGEILSKKMQKENEILKIQDKCEHSWHEYGHDSHYSYYVCDICGRKERY